MMSSQVPATLGLMCRRASTAAAASGTSSSSSVGVLEDHQDYLSRILNARVYEIAIETPLQPAPYMSTAIHNTVMLKVPYRMCAWVRGFTHLPTPCV